MRLISLRKQLILEKENSDPKLPLPCQQYQPRKRFLGVNSNKKLEPLRQFIVVYNHSLAAPATATAAALLSL